MKNNIAAMLVLASLVACGGGGGDSEPPITVTISPSTATTSGVVGMYPDGVGLQVSAVLSRTPTGTVYPVIQSNSSAIRSGVADAIVTGTNTYSVIVHSMPTLTAGTYTGTLSLRLCKDAQCASEYPLTGASVPFSIKMIPLPTFTLTTTPANGAPSTITVAAGNPYDVPNGQAFTLTSDTPVTWSVQNDEANISGQTTTATVFSGVVTKVSGISGGIVDIFATPVDVPDYSMRFMLEPQ